MHEDCLRLNNAVFVVLIEHGGRIFSVTQLRYKILGARAHSMEEVRNLNKLRYVSACTQNDCTLFVETGDDWKMDRVGQSMIPQERYENVNQ